MHAQQVKEICAHCGAAHVQGSRGSLQKRGSACVAAIERDLAEGTAALAPLVDVEIGASIAQRPLFARFVNLYQAPGVLERKRSQQNAIDHGKHGAGGAHSNGHGCDHGDGETGRAPQRPQRIAKVVGEPLQPPPPPGFVRHVLDQRGVAKLPRRFGLGLLPRLSAAHPVGNVQSHVDTDFFVQLVLALFKPPAHFVPPPYEGWIYIFIPLASI
jgi:hypothetical protein